MPRTDITGWQIPKYSELVSRVEADYDAAMQAIQAGTNPIVYSTLVGLKPVWCKTLAGASYLLHEAGAYIVRQVFVQHSDSEFLDVHGTNRGIPRKDGTFSTRVVRATGVNTAVIDAGSKLQFLTGSESLTFTVLESGTISSGSVELVIRADQIGVASNLAVGSILYWSNSITGVDPTAVVIEGAANEDGVDIEDADAYAERMLDALSNKGAPASPPSLREIALAVPGISNAWVSRATPYPGDALVLFTSVNATATGGINYDDGGAYHLPITLDSTPTNWVYLNKADLEGQLGRDTNEGDFAGGMMVLRSRNPLTREWIPLSYDGLVSVDSDTWKIELAQTPNTALVATDSIHILGPSAWSVYEAIYAQSETGGTSQTLYLPADGMEAIVTTPRPLELTMTIGLPNNTSAMRASVLASLKSMVAEYAKPGGSITSWMVRNAIQNAEGHVSHTLPLFMGHSGDYTSTASTYQLHVLLDDNVTFTSI